jgi:hypothetical protein
LSKTVSARIPNKNHQEIFERCNRSGCTINEWLNASIEFTLTGSSDFDFGEIEEDESEIESKPEITVSNP